MSADGARITRAITIIKALLTAPEAVTVSQLSEESGISKRQISRDIAAINKGGLVEITGLVGPGGGVYIGDESRQALVGLCHPALEE